MDNVDNVGIVRRKPFDVLKEMCDGNMISKLIHGGLVNKFNANVNEVMLEKIREDEEKNKNEIEKKDNSMFGQEFLREMGILQNSNGEYYIQENHETKFVRKEVEEVCR